jgi:hypothetical protein
MLTEKTSVFLQTKICSLPAGSSTKEEIIG